MKTETIIIIALVVIIILFVVYNRSQNGLIPDGHPVVNRHAFVQPKGTGDGSVAPATTSTTGLNTNLVLALGTTGPEVTLLQSWLQVGQTGVFDQATLTALQNALGVGSVTLNQFQILAPTKQTTPIGDISNFSGPDESGIGLAGGTNENV